MKRLLVLVAVATAALGVLAGMAELTQSRPDTVPPGSTSRVVFSVYAKRYPHEIVDAANALWGTCQGTTPSRATTAVEPVGDAWQVVVEPALGEHAKRRLIGCVKDLTVDRVKANIRSIELLPADAGGR